MCHHVLHILLGYEHRAAFVSLVFHFRGTLILPCHHLLLPPTLLTSG